MKFTMGQDVIATESYGRRGRSHLNITRVGRIYVYTGSGYNERKFRGDSGDEDIKGGYVGGHLYSLEEMAASDRRLDTIRQLRELGIDLHGKGYSIPSESLEKVLWILQDSQS